MGAIIIKMMMVIIATILQQQKKRKKVKDPNAPKRPTNAFISFSNIMRKNWKGSSKIEMADITEAWKSKKQAKVRLSLEKKYTKEYQIWKKKNETYLATKEGGGGDEDDEAEESTPLTGPKSATTKKKKKKKKNTT